MSKNRHHKNTPFKLRFKNIYKTKSSWVLGGLFVLAFAVVLAASLFTLFNHPNQASASGETVGFVGSSGSGLETVSNPGVTVNISSILSTNVNINYSVSGGVLGSDYSLNGGTGSSSGSVTIVAGQKSVGIPIKIINNSKVESNKVLVISLSSVSGASLGSNSIYTYTVLDDDSSNTNLTGSDPDSLPSFDYTGINSLKVTDGLKLKLDAQSLSTNSTITDPYNSLALHANGNEGQTTTTDVSGNPKTLTFNGDAKISTTNPKFGSGSLSFDGNGDYLSTPANTDFNFGTGDFTIESWVNPNSLPSSPSSASGIFARSNSSYGTFEYSLGVSTSNISFYYGVRGSYQVRFDAAVPTISNGSWHHIAVSRSGTSWKMFLDGVGYSPSIFQESATANFAVDLTSTNPVTIGYFGNAAGSVTFLDGKMDDLRVSKGLARYTTDFSVPSNTFNDTVSSNLVSSWNDDSGNNNNATQSIGTNMPIVVSNVLNGKNVVRFDGVNDIINTPNVDLSTNQAVSVFTVNKTTGSNTASVIENSANSTASSATTGFILSVNDNTCGSGCPTPGVAATLKGNSDYSVNYSPTTPNSFTAYDAIFDKSKTSSEASLYINGSKAGSQPYNGNNTNNFGNNQFFIGGRGDGSNVYLNGDIAEVLVYNRSLNDSERKQVECYLSNKYGLALKSCTNAIQLKLDASAISGNDGSSVASWTDTSGNNNNATQATTASQPVLKTGTNGINGKNVVSFDGSQSLLSTNPTIPINSDYSVIAVESRNTSTSSNYFIGDNGNSTTNQALHLGYRSNGVLTQAQFGNDLDVAVPGFTTKKPALDSFVFNGLGHSIYTGGVLLGTNSNASGLTSYNKLKIGGAIGGSYTGDIAEVIVYNRALSDFERTQVECYLGKKYNLSVSACAMSGGPKLWLDASTISGTDGSSVAVWNDISGNGNDASQSTLASQPTLKTGANGMNGKNVLRFDGVDDYLSAGDKLDLGSNNFSLIAVSKFNTSSGGPIVSKSSARGLNGRWAFTPDTGKLVFLFDDSNGVNVLGNTAIDTTSTLRTGIINRGQKTKTFLNGSANGESGGNSAYTYYDTGDGLYVGQYGNSSGTGPISGGYLAGDIPEILIFNTALSNSQRSLIETYLGNKYGITISNNKYALSSSTSGSLTGIGAEGDGLSLLSGSSGGLYLADNGINSDGKYILSSVGSGEYLMAGNDGATGLSTSDLGSTGVSKRWNRVWGIDKTATDGINGKISFDFSEYKGGVPSSSNLANYKLLYRSSGSGNFSVVTTSGNASLDSGDRISFGVDDANLLDGYYTLGTTSEASNPLSLPDSVSDLSVVSGNKQVTLNWSVPSGSSGISDYVIQYSSDNFVNEVLTFDDGVSTNTSSVVVNNLESNTRYAFRVIATNKSGSGTYSNSVDTTTSGGSPSISSLSPSNGPTTGGNTVTINGSNFGKSGYKKVITLTNSGSALTNYEASLTLDTQSLISTGKMRQDCGDIRFSDSDNFTGLQYWIESGCNTTSTIVWVRIPSTPAGTKTISLIYGNSSLSSNSDLSNFSFAGVIGTSTPKALWLKASDGTGQTVDGSPVSTWLDKSGNAYDASQPTTTNQPVLKTGVLNGKSVVRFDGASSRIGGNIVFTGSTSASTFLVTSTTTTTSGRIPYSVGGYWFYYINRFTTGKYFAGYDGSSGNNNSSNESISTINNGNFFSLSGSNDGTITNLYVNGILENSYADTIATGSNTYMLGANVDSSNFYPGDIAESITFTTKLSETDRQSVELYLRNKYNLGGNTVTASAGSEQSTNTATVTFGANNATNVNILNTSQISVIVPANSTPGVITLTLTLDSNTMTSSYEYKAPAITSVSPNSGPTTGGTEVLIDGNYFSDAATKKQITITNPGSYSVIPIKASDLNLDNLKSQNKIQQDCKDIKIKDTDGAADLPFWLDGGCNNNATIWVKFNSPPASGKIIYTSFTNDQSAVFTGGSVGNVFPLLTSSNNKSWVKADNFASTTTDNTKITSWQDITGNGNNYNQASTSQQPKYRTNILNGKPVIEFVNSSSDTMANSLNYTSSPYTILYVSRQTGGTNRRVLAGVNNNYLMGYHGGGRDKFYAEGWVNNPSTPSDTLWHLYSAIGNGGTISSFYGNSQLIAANSNGVQGPNGISLNGGYYGEYSDAQIAEVVVFNSSLSTSDRQSIEDYLNIKYNLYNSSNLPTVQVGGEVGAMKIYLGSTLITSPQRISASKYKIITPLGVVGSLPIKVVGPDGVESNTNFTFTYAAPIINSISPNSGPTSGGTSVTITGNYFAGSGYSKNITISSSETLADYQISFTLDTASLISQGKMRSDCGDLRVKTTDDAITLPYFIESDCNSTNTVIWTKTPSLSIGDNTFKITYGNPINTSQSSSSNVFPFFDDFSGDLSNWTSATGPVATSNGIVTINGGGSLIKDMNNLPTNFIVESRYQKPSEYRNRMYLTTTSLTGAPTGYDYGDFNGYGIYWNGSGPSIGYNTWYQVNWENSSTNYVWKINNDDGSNILTRSYGSKIAGLNRLILTGTESSASILKFDYVRVRTYSATQPTVSIGSEINSATKVYINNVLAPQMLINSLTQITFISPPNLTGTYPIKVVAPDGVESNTNITYSYASPVVNSISPTFGPNTGGTFVTISGSNFGSIGYYSAALTVNNPDNNVLTNYQTKFVLNTASLISSGKLGSDCSNIRVRDISNNDLPYYLESGCNTASTVFWIKIPSIGANASLKLNLLYGNSSWNSQSSGSNVFDFFDDFNSTNLNPAWTFSNNGNSNNAYSLTTNPGKLTLTTQSSDSYIGIYSVATLYTNQPSTDWESTVTIDAHPNANYAIFGLSAYSSNTNWYTIGKGYHGSYGNENIHFKRLVNNGFSETGVSNTQSPLYFKIRKVGSSHQAFWSVDQTNWTSFGSNDSLNTTLIGLMAQSTSGSQAASYDDFKIRKYAPLDLTTTLASESPVINVSFGSSQAVFKFLSSQTLTGYVPAGTGSVSITVTNSDGSSGTSSSPLYTYGTNNVPNPVNDLNITSTEGGNVGLSWSAPFDNGSSISDYVIKYSSDNFVNDIHTFNDGVSTVNSTLVSGLTPGQSYQFKVISSNSSNVNGGNGLNNSLDSNIVSVSKLDCDTDLAGADLIIATNQVLTGRYCNVNLFQVNSGITASLENQATISPPFTGKAVKIYAQSANILGTIDGTGKGYLGGGQSGNTSFNGLGSGGGSEARSASNGGGYGGKGGWTNGGSTYGSITQPVDLGSGGGRDNDYGGAGGNGGGAVKLTISGTTTINGSILANGNNGGYGNGAGGSGGSIWIDSNTLTGSGIITANGGNHHSYVGTSGGGGGGRIALYYNTKSLTNTTPVSAAGGVGNQYGGAGTVYEKQASDTYGSLTISNLINNTGNLTPVSGGNSGINNLKNFTIQNAYVPYTKVGNALTVSDTIIIQSSATSSDSSKLATLELSGNETYNFSNLVIKINSILNDKPNTNTQSNWANLNLANLDVQAGGKIDVSGLGYLGGGQSGNTSFNGLGSGGGSEARSASNGGGYGGKGGWTNGGSTYGSITQPVDLGSGGGRDNDYGGAGGNGGGAVKLTISGTTTINGSILANGNNGGYGNGAGGSGGSIWIDSNTLTGSGIITANGGNHHSYVGTSGGGGGGRIALYYNTKSLTNTTPVSAAGGVGNQYGGAGTVYDKNKSDSSKPNGDLIISNLTGNTGNFTSLFDSLNQYIYDNITVQNAYLDYTKTSNTLSVVNTLTLQSSTTSADTTKLAALRVNSTGTYNITNFVIKMNGVLTHIANTSTQDNSVIINSTNLDVQAGGKIDVSGLGYLGGGQSGNTSFNGLGSGGGSEARSASNGGGYGGKGGWTNGGSTYGSITQPVDLGSGGGRDNDYGGAGGNGGGAVKLTISGTTTINGSILANGNNGGYGNGAGGSGGSIWIDSNTLTGSGIITANGGNHHSYVGTSGGGGGGRIALYYQNRTGSLTQGTSTSSITVNGGSGNGDCNEVLTGSNPSAYTNNTSGCTGTIYDPNTPETNLSSATLTTNPNPVSQGSAFAASVTNVKNTFGFSLFSGTCSVSITGPGNFSSAVVRSGTVASGVCTLASSFPAPDTAGSFSSSASVTGNGNTQNATIPFTVYAPASGRALADTTFTTQPKSPYYLLPSPTINLIGAGGPSLSASGFIDSGNNQALNGVVCTFLVTGPNSYSQTFASSPMIGGSCSYTFSAFELPSALLTSSGNYSVNVSVPGVDSGNNNVTLTTTSATFNRFYDIYLELAGNPGTYNNLGTIPGASTSTPSTIALGNNAIISSPVIKKYNNSSLITTPLACVNTVEINNNSSPIVKTYTSTINPSGQCVTTLPSADLSSGTLRTKTSITLVLNSQNLVFQTNYTTIPTTGFPSNLAKYNSSPTVSTPELQPIYNTGASNIVSASPSFVGSSITLTVSGLIDSANNLPLGANSVGPVCSFLITRPDLSTTSVNSPAASSGSCAVTVSNTELGISGGSFSFRMSLSGKDNLNNDATLTTPSVSFARRYDVNLTGANGLTGNLPGAVSTTPNPILATQNSTVTSPTFKKFDGATNLSSSTPCRIVFRYINGSTSTQTITTYDGTLNGNSQCTATIPASSVPVAGNSYIKARVALFGSALSSSSSDVFETGESQVLVKNPNTSKICSPVFRDDNSNKIWDTTSLNGQQNQLGLDEPYLLGVNLKLLDNTLTPISGKTLTTALPTSGNPNINCFSSLFDDTYYLELTLPAGTTLTTPDSTNLPGGVTLIRDGQNVITGLRYRIVLGVNDAQTFTTGLNGNSRICTAGSFVDLDGNGSLNGSDYKLTKPTRLYLSSNLTTPVNTLTTSTTAPICFTSLPPSAYDSSSVSYVVEQDVPPSSDPDFLAGGQLTTLSQSISGYGTISLAQQVSNTKARTGGITLTNGQDFNGLVFGYKRLASYKAKAQGSPNQTKAISTGNNFAAVVNSSEVSGKIYARYKFNTRFTGLIDSATGGALTIPNTQPNFASACSVTFSGPSFNSPQQAYGTITNGTCLVDPIPDNSGNGNTAEMTVDGDNGTLGSTGNFDVLDGKVNICSATFADYSGDANRQGSEPYLAGRTLKLFNNATNTEVQASILSTTSGNDCFSNVTPGITYRLEETAFSGNTPTTNSGSSIYTFTPDPEVNQNFKFGYRGNSTICPLAFRDDSGDGIKNTNAYGDSEPYVSGVFTATLLDNLNNQVGSFSINNSGCFTNLLSGDYTLSQSYASGLKVGRTNFSSGSTTINSLGVGQSVSREFGYQNQATICPNPTFSDYNKNGVQDSGEPVINSLPVKLIRVSGSTQIGSDLILTGSNCFTGTIPDTYQVVETKPVGGSLTTSASSGVSSYSQTSTTATALITTTLGVDLNTPFGYKGNATICPYPTFRDVNKNGAKDSGETDIDGVSTSLKDGAGTVISTILTNAGTSTCFTELLAGSYRLIQVSPQNTSSTTGGVDKAVDNLGAGETRSVAFGYNGDPRICPITFRDDNSNLIYDNGEITLSGVTVTLKDFSGATTLNTLTTSTSSSNCFTGLTAGTYLVQVSNLNNYSLTTVSSRSVTVNFGDSLSPQFGYNGSGTICVNPTFKDSNSSGSFDSGETYFTGVNTYLKYPSGSLVTPLQATNSSGATCFTGVAPGSYVVAQDAPSGSTSTTGGAQSVSLAPSETKTLAFGYNGSGTICANPTFDDANFDGAKNTAENYLSGVNTKLYLLPDTTNVFKSATTNSLGTACFVGLFPGNYTISQDLPSGYTSGSSTTGGSQTFALTSSQYKTVAFGYTTNPDYILGAIRGFLYIDRNENGVYNPNGQDAAQITVFDNDIPVTKAEVQLLKKNTTTNLYEFVSSTLSVSDPNNPESDGTYAFTALNPGDYKVVIVTPQGTSPVSPNPPERLVTITGSQKVVAQDFGFQYTAKICPALFVDKNKNNIFDTGDVDLIATRGAYYQLSYQSYNGSQVASNYNTYGYLINSANPCIEKVPPRDYTLIFRSDLAGLLNYSSSFDNSFYNQVTPNQSLTIYLGNQVNTSNRYYTNFVPNYTNSIIQGRVWHNRPPNNSFDGNGYDDQTGISGGRDYSYDDDFAYSGVNMSLKKCGVGFGEVQADVDSWNNSMPTSVTDANGYYTFPTVPPGTYAVIRNTTLPSEAALNGLPVNDCSYPSNYLFINNTYQYGGGYAPGSTITYDIVLSYKASINSTLYIDQNHNGVYDSFETNGPNGGLVGGTLTLTNSVGNVVAVQDSNSSNYAPPYGSSFPQVPPDNYTVSLSERVNTISNYDSYYSLVEYPSSCPTGYSQLGGTDLRFEFDYTYDSNNRSGRFCIKDSEFSSFNFVDYATGSCPTGYSQLGGTDLRFEFDYTYDSNNRSGRMCVKDSELSKFSFVDYATGSCPTGYSQLNNTDTRMEFDYTYDSNNRSGRFCIQTSIQRTETFTYPLLPADQAPKTVNVTTATDATNLSYGFNPTNNSVISGKVFVDRNNNNIYQPSGADNSSSTTFDNDTPIANSTIQLYYGAILDPVASKFVASTTSDSSGDYSFSGLSEGYYSARITTAAPAGTNCTRCDWGYNSFRTDLVYVGKDSTSTQNLRYNYNGSLTFKAFHDTIVNSVRDGIELDASGMKFTVTSTDGYTLGTSDPNPCCTHSFDNLPPGTYSVNINNIPAGISLTGGYSTTDSLSVLASENYTRDYPFTPYTNNIIQGYIFVDRNLNGVLEVNGVDNAANTFDDEKPFGLATVRITGPLGTYSTTTNSSGFYQFTGLSTGNYKLHTTGVEPDVDLNDPLASQVVARCFTALDCKSPYGDGDGQISFSWSGGQLASSTVTRGVNLYAASTVTNNFSYEYTNTLNARCIDDLNGDGSITTYADTGYTEGPINGCSFRITTPTGEYLTFSAGSNISASRLPPGSYTITKLSNVSGRTNTNTFRRDITPNINLGDQSSVTQTFTAAAGFYQKGYYNFMQFAQPITNNSAITGKTYIDKAQDSLYQANGIDGNPLTLEDNDILLPNISIALTGTTPVGTITRSTSTNIDGKYQFTDLPRGSFTVVGGLGG